MPVKIVVAVVVLAALLSIPSCVTTSGGAWRFDSAATPEGWPPNTPVGEVELREVPAYRVAEVTRGEAAGDARDPMFMQLFRHIDDNDIAMTAPVEMEYGASGGDPQMTSMAFLYRDASIGAPGSDGNVVVRDVEPQLYASTGVRGGYDDETFREGRARLEAWLAENDDYRAVGPYRFLGYNGPFTLPFLRYGEVQVPVEAR